MPKASAESPPLLQCVGGKSIFAVSGDSLSTFHYSITGGVFLDTTKRDSVVVQWGMQGGSYQVGVQEIAFGGCEGEWVYIDVELKGTPFSFANAEQRLCPGDTLHIPIDTDVYENIRWSDTDVGRRGIVQPGNYQVWVQDQNGCQYTDTVNVTICDLPPIQKSLKQSNKLSHSPLNKTSP